MLALPDLLASKVAQDLLDTWQARVLRAAEGKLGAVVLSVLAHNYDEQMPVLLRVVYPGFTSIAAPFLYTAGRVAKTGQIVAGVITRDGGKIPNGLLFNSESAMEGAFRRLADKARLDDDERVQLFVALKKWVVADHRLDPTMDPKDPDAKRLTVN